MKRGGVSTSAEAVPVAPTSGGHVIPLPKIPSKAPSTQHPKNDQDSRFEKASGEMPCVTRTPWACCR